MADLSELLWTLKAKGICVHSNGSGFEQENAFVCLGLCDQELRGWRDLLERLNAVLDHPFRLIDTNTRLQDGRFVYVTASLLAVLSVS